MDPRVRGVSTGKARRALQRRLAETQGAAPAAAPEPEPTPVPDTYNATDGAAELMAKERIVPLVVPGTGAAGRILKADVEDWMKARETA